MYAQQINGQWTELRGNIVFSPTVYQTAESLTDEQRAQFSVYPLDNVQPSFDPETQTAERTGYAFDEQTQRVSVVWTVRDLTVEERRARIPTVVSMRQGRRAMLETPFGNGTLLDVIEQMIESIPDATQRRAARIDWEYGQEIKRDFPLVQQLVAQLGMTEEQIDQLFLSASAL